jgi:hypothetical protein
LKILTSEMATYMKVLNEAGIEMHGMPNDGQFYATSTMLGCVPGEDKNRRYVYCWPSDEPVLVMNKHMERWGKRDEERLQVVLLALNSHANQGHEHHQFQSSKWTGNLMSDRDVQGCSGIIMAILIIALIIAVFYSIA